MKLHLACVCLGLCLTSCGAGPGVTGNDTGGIIPYPLVANQGGSDRAAAEAMASDHCARYGKVAVVTSIHREYGDYVSFDCVWPDSTFIRRVR